MLTSDDAFVDFIGDLVMAIYLVDMPSLGERTADIMLAAARRLVDAVRHDAQSLPVGVGMHMGKAQVGSLATVESKNFTAVGDVVNTAARLQSAAGANEILVSEKVYGAFRGETAGGPHHPGPEGKSRATDRLHLALSSATWPSAGSAARLQYSYGSFGFRSVDLSSFRPWRDYR